jgi:hypothetical protein
MCVLDTVPVIYLFVSVLTQLNQVTQSYEQPLSCYDINHMNKKNESKLYEIVLRNISINAVDYNVTFQTQNINKYHTDDL